MNEGEGFDSEGVALDNPHLRRVSFTDTEVAETVDAEPRGIWIPLAADVKTFRMRIEEAGIITVEILGDGTWGIEWIQDA